MLDMTDRLGTNMATENQKIETDNGKSVTDEL